MEAREGLQAEVEQLKAQLAAQTAVIEVARQQVAHCEVCRVNIRDALSRLDAADVPAASTGENEQ